jgi:hypothetical protein
MVQYVHPAQAQFNFVSCPEELCKCASVMAVETQLIRNTTLPQNFSDSSIHLEGLRKTMEKLSVKITSVQV